MASGDTNWTLTGSICHRLSLTALHSTWKCVHECVWVCFCLQHCKITSDRCIEDTAPPFYTTAPSKSLIVTCLYVKQLGKRWRDKRVWRQEECSEDVKVRGNGLKSHRIRKTRKPNWKRKIGGKKRGKWCTQIEEEVAFELFCPGKIRSCRGGGR